MSIIDPSEARANLDRCAKECRSSPVPDRVDGTTAFEPVPIRSDDPEFIDRLLADDPAFARLLEDRRREADQGLVSTLESVRERLDGASS